MSTLTIRNIGPIIDVSLDLNKVNVIMGPQSSGKSTIAKIISYCTWVEKDVSVNQSLDAYKVDGYFKKKIEEFHKLRGYFKKDAEIVFESEVVKLQYADQKLSIEWVDKYAYKRSKIAYIPAERNIVIMPEMEKVEIPNNNIRSFLFDWFDAREIHSKEKYFAVLDLGMSYYFNEESKENHIVVAEGPEKNDILLSNASSGLQSIVPLITIIEYLTGWIYNNEQDISFEEDKKQTSVSHNLNIELVVERFVGKEVTDKDDLKSVFKIIKKMLDENDDKVLQLVDYWSEVTNNLFKTNNTQLIIEEPEQNLFPVAQRDLVYYMLGKCKDGGQNHRLSFTTHSPYILYALNNCMMGYIISDKMPEVEQAKLKSRQAWIDPKLVSVWEIENGKIKSIQGEDGLIGNNYFDVSMKNVMDDFYCMLNYYGDEE